MLQKEISSMSAPRIAFKNKAKLWSTSFKGTILKQATVFPVIIYLIPPILIDRYLLFHECSLKLHPMLKKLIQLRGFALKANARKAGSSKVFLPGHYYWGRCSRGWKPDVKSV